MARAPAWAKHLHECLHETKTAVADLRTAIGEERVDASGRVSGTGLTGRVIRTETKVLSYDRLKERVIGAAMGLSAALAILWWLTKDKLAAVFGVHS